MLKIEYIEPKKLKPHPKNPRIHPESALKKLEMSIKEYGWTNPVLVSSDNFILAGHARLKAAERAGLKTVPIIRLPLSGKKADAYLVADNRLNQDTSWNFLVLKELLVDLDNGEFNLEITGFDEKELRSMIDFSGLIPMPELSSEEDHNFEQMSFTLHKDQAITVRQAMSKATKGDDKAGEENKNRNGNSLFVIARSYLEK